MAIYESRERLKVFKIRVSFSNHAGFTDVDLFINILEIFLFYTDTGCAFNVCSGSRCSKVGMNEGQGKEKGLAFRNRVVFISMCSAYSLH